MSKHQEASDQDDRNVPVKLKLHICLFTKDQNFANSVINLLSKDTYKLTVVSTKKQLIELIQKQHEKIDCLLLCNQSQNPNLYLQMQQLGTLLPLLIIYQHSSEIDNQVTLYHPAEVKFSFTQSKQLDKQINLALNQFLNLIPPNFFEEKTEATFDSLIAQQRRLEEKLKERLNYLGLYYKRNPQEFYQNLNQKKQQELYQQLSKEYRHVILIYFEENPDINKLIDHFVNLAFFSDVSVSKILEIHMELMDEFSQQLKLEGRSEDILLDYRLALIDIIAHLCEMYRRSISREDVSSDIFV